MRTEKRTSPRQRLRREIFIHVPVQCTLSDISVTGARLLLDRHSDVPPVFIIEIKPGLYRWCREVWRDANEIGIEFIRRPEKIVTKNHNNEQPAAQAGSGAADESPARAGRP